MKGASKRVRREEASKDTIRGMHLTAVYPALLLVISKRFKLESCACFPIADELIRIM